MNIAEILLTWLLNNNQLININVSCYGSHLGIMIDINISRSTTKEHFSQVCCSVVEGMNNFLMYFPYGSVFKLSCSGNQLGFRISDYPMIIYTQI